MNIMLSISPKLSPVLLILQMFPRNHPGTTFFQLFVTRFDCPVKNLKGSSYSVLDSGCSTPKKLVYKGPSDSEIRRCVPYSPSLGTDNRGRVGMEDVQDNLNFRPSLQVVPVRVSSVPRS